MAKIFTLSEASSIAIHAMILVLNSKEKLNANQIADNLGSSRAHVAKVMQRLVKEGYLSSNRGPSGGFEMRIQPSTITLYDIYRIIEGALEAHECPVNYQVCTHEKCIFGNFGSKITREFKEYLQGANLESYKK